jgi:hypothetical protein
MFNELFFDLDDVSDHLAEIDRGEVERVVAVLDDLIRAVESQTIKVYLHAACEEIGKLAAADDDAPWAEAA